MWLEASEHGIHRRSAAFGVGLAALASIVGCKAFGGMSDDGESVPTIAPEGGVCLGTCLADPGWKITPDCGAATAGIDRFLILDFEAGVATNLYTYSDGTTFPPAFMTNGGEIQAGYQPPTQVLPAGQDLCFPNNSVLHIIGGETKLIDGTLYGGPFRAWGGGMGIPLQKHNGRTGGPDTTTGKCSATPAPGNCAPGFRSDLVPIPPPGQMPGLCLPDPCPQTDEVAVDIGSLDLSQYDGISFWARRGLNSQMGMRVLIGDKYTDDDLNFYANRYNRQNPQATPQPLYCQRVRECVCRNQTPCTFGLKEEQATEALSLAFSLIAGANPGWYCRPDSLSDLIYLRNNAAGNVDLSGGGSIVYCGSTQCDQVNPAFPDQPDLQFAGRPCTPYEWPNGISTSYCFDPATDPPPAPSTEGCGDHWTKVVDLSTEWQFYKVPFVDMRQQGWAKRSDHLDLKSASIVRFTWDVGYIDYWIDELSIYRNQR